MSHHEQIQISILEAILKTVERIEKRINRCGNCVGVGSYQFQNTDILCTQCNGLGVLRNE